MPEYSGEVDLEECPTIYQVVFTRTQIITALQELSYFPFDEVDTNELLDKPEASLVPDEDALDEEPEIFHQGGPGDSG